MMKTSQGGMTIPDVVSGVELMAQAVEGHIQVLILLVDLADTAWRANGVVDAASMV